MEKYVSFTWVYLSLPSRLSSCSYHKYSNSTEYWKQLSCNYSCTRRAIFARFPWTCL